MVNHVRITFQKNKNLPHTSLKPEEFIFFRKSVSLKPDFLRTGRLHFIFETSIITPKRVFVTEGQKHGDGQRDQSPVEAAVAAGTPSGPP